MAKLIYWALNVALLAALAIGLDMRGAVGAAVVCWILSGFCSGLVLWYAVGVVRG
jgi:hypothetical protein